MPDNQRLPSTLNQGDFFSLDGWSVVAMEGPEAVAFAHAQFASDVNALAVARWHWSAWLNPKGRVLALFALLRVGEHSLRLVLPDADAAGLAEALRRFVFRRKVTITARPDLHLSGAFATPAVAGGATLAGSGDAGIELDFGATGLPRTLRIGPEAAPSNPDAVIAWTVADLRTGLPRLAQDQAGQWTPQQLGLERLRAFSVSKGCYPGQEIVARTHFLGKAKREALLLQVANATLAGTEVTQDGRGIGTVVSVAGQAPRLALAVLPLERTGSPLQVAGDMATAEPLMDGLAR